MGDKLLTCGIVYLTCHFVVNVILASLAGSGAGKGSIFKHTIAEVSSEHPVDITPAGYTFSIWSVIFIWILVAYVYLIINLFRSTPAASSDDGHPVFGRFVTLALIINSFVFTAWLFLWDNEEMTASAVCLILIAVTNWVALIIFSVSLWKKMTILKTEAPTDLLLHRILIQNGFGVYATWTTVASLINLAVALKFDGETVEPKTSFIALSLLCILLIIWTSLELIFFDNYFRYLLTPLLVVLWALVGVWMEQGQFLGDIDDGLAWFTSILVFSTAALVILRAAVAVYRHLRRPLYIGIASTTSNGNTADASL